MEKQINRYTPTNEELEGLDNLISKIPDLQNLIEENADSLDLIIKGIDTLRIDNVYKKRFETTFHSSREDSCSKRNL